MTCRSSSSGRQVVDRVGDPAVLDLAVRRLDETERVDAAVGRQRPDQADIGAFRRLDRAHPAVVARVHIADLHTRAVPGQPTRPQRRQPPLVGQARERVGLVHELRQLRGAEELLDRRHHRADVDQRLRVIASTSWVVMRSRTTRSMRDRPTRIWFWISSPTVRSRRLPKWSMSSVS